MDDERMKNRSLRTLPIIALTLSDEKLSMPVYLSGIRNEDDWEDIGLGPLIFIWNVGRVAEPFSLSVNGKAIAHLFEPFVPEITLRMLKPEMRWWRLSLKYLLR